MNETGTQTAPIVYLSRSGPPEAMSSPVLICVTCGMMISSATPANIKWSSGHAGTVLAHKGNCDQAHEEATKHSDRWMTADVDEFLQQLMNNFVNQIVEEPGVEYVAPTPLDWKIGTYKR